MLFLVKLIHDSEMESARRVGGKEVRQKCKADLDPKQKDLLD